MLHKVWGKGNILAGTLTNESAEYVAKYTVKKLTSASDERLGGRNPEFSRMSNRRGIGYDALWDVADAVMKYGIIGNDVPGVLRFGKSEKPLGRYLHGNLREMVGREKEAPQAVMDEIQAEMLPVLLSSIENEESYAKALSRVSDGDYANLLARSNMFRRKGL